MSDEQPHKIVDPAAGAETEESKEEHQAVKDYSAPDKNKQLTMEVKVHSPFHDYYDGQAFSISGENITGPFDILPSHHNFITLLSACDLIVRTVKKGDQKIRISGGIMHVKADKVIVFLDV